jgi:8-oxo-dGTP pyrophosphatase MutT (NUDIX family)
MKNGRFERIPAFVEIENRIMRLIHKAVCCVTQNDAILCFEHPTAGFQIPKGTVEEGETPVQACLRELNEETGLLFDAEPISLGTLERIVGAGAREDGPLERHLWHLFELPFTGLPQSWMHIARGSVEEKGLAFRFFWHALSVEPIGFHEIFARTIEMVRYHRQPTG